MLNRLWLSAAVGLGLILVWGLRGEAYAAQLTEDGTDQTICDPTGACLFALPTGIPKFSVKFRSDVLGVGFASPDTEGPGNELADLLTVTFPGETQKSASGERGQALQNGFVNGGTVPIDTVTFVEPTTIRTFFSDRVDLFFDTANTKVAVTFASDVPEPATTPLLSAGLTVLLGYRWRRERRVCPGARSMQSAGPGREG